ncbi:MAG: hypothetical protein HamCj_21370 [Candidatus Hamiltonella defensa (Ceratovacuna japonica)]
MSPQKKIKNIAELRKILDKKSHLLILNIERGEEKLLIIIQISKIISLPAQKRELSNHSTFQNQIEVCVVK